MRLSLRLFKNRELVQVHDLQQQWNSGRWWEEVSGTLRKATDNAFAKYEGYDVQELHIETADKRFQYTPAKACILWRIHPHEHIDGADRGDGVDEVDAAIEQHNATMYETVQAHPPVSPLSIGGHRVVPCSLNRNASPHQADIRNLSKTVWKQLGQTGDPTILLLKLKKQRLSEEEVTVAKDDVTGDVYPYRITRVLYLTRQDRKDMDAPKMVHDTDTSDADTGDDGDDEPVVGWGVKGVDDGQGGQGDAQEVAPHDIGSTVGGRPQDNTSSYQTLRYSLNTSVGLIHFEATHTCSGNVLRHRQLFLYREDSEGRLTQITDDADLATPLANKMLDDLHLSRCQENPQLEQYTLNLSHELQSYSIHITVCPYQGCYITAMQPQPSQPYHIVFTERVVVTDAKSGTCHTATDTLHNDQLCAIKELFKDGVDAEAVTAASREFELAEAALHGARPDVTGISDEMLCERFGEQCAVRAKELREEAEKDAQNVVDDVYQ